ncbi:5-formyltetrahydrofolate cyclo-ligase [Virgibacillus flavescens]|uniref:5-formyltetrahydrofolate cyclo-ligase n=1 Tax=Virgibacillus flavescens TaxID=1611422 RepID=UPI003D337A63
MICLDKSQLRNKTILYLKSLSNEEKKSTESKLTDQLIHSNIWKNATSIGITISQGFEWDTREIIESAWRQGKQVSVPKCEPVTKALRFYEFKTYDQLEVVYYNLKEPNPIKSKLMDKNQMDLLVVPGLIFDKNKFRIGFGGGYYDRFLTDFSHTTVSLLSREQLVDKIPKETFDLPIDYLISENEIYK